MEYFWKYIFKSDKSFIINILLAHVIGQHQNTNKNVKYEVQRFSTYNLNTKLDMAQNSTNQNVIRIIFRDWYRGNENAVEILYRQKRYTLTLTTSVGKELVYYNC